MQRRALTAVALSLGMLSAPSWSAAQSNRNVPGQDTPRLLVAVLASKERGLGREVSDAIRTRFTNQMNARVLYIIPREQMVNFLESSGYKADSSLGATDLKELARGLRTDYIVGGFTGKVGTNMRVEPQVMLARDPSIGQPLPVIESGSLNDIGRQVERLTLEALKQMPDNRACENSLRTNAYDKAIAAANAGIQKYPQAVIARLCLANAFQNSGNPDSVLKVTEFILKADPKSKPAMQFAFAAYKAKADAAKDSAVSQGFREQSVRVLIAMMGVDPMNASLLNNVVTELAKLGKPSVAVPIIDDLLKQNPGDPPLLNQKWKLMLADAASADSAVKSAKFAAALTAGEEMVKADSALADSVYYSRQVAAAMQSSVQASIEWTSRAVRKYPTNQDYWWYKARQERAAGQIQAAQSSLSRLLALNPKYQGANVMLGQLFLDQKMTDSALAVARRAVAGGEDSKTWGNFLLLPARDAVQLADKTGKDSVAASKREHIALWENALALSQEADKLNPGATSKFFIGIASFTVGLDAVQQAQTLGRPAKGQRTASKDALAQACASAKKGQNMFLLTQLNMPAGGPIDKKVAGDILGYVQQYSPIADQMEKQYCKT